MCRIKQILLLFLVGFMPVSAQNVMQNGKVEDMVSLIKLSEKLAEAKVKKALKSDKNNTDMIANIGQAYLQAGKIEEAEKYFWMAQHCHKISTKALNLGGDIAVEKRDVDSALYYYKRAMYFDRHDPEGYYNYAMLMKSKDLDDAIAKLKYLQAVRPDLPVSEKIAELYYSSSDYQAAVAQYEKTPVENMSEDELTHYAQAVLLSGDYTKTLQVAAKGHERFPQNTDFMRLMMYCYTDKENYEEALKSAQALLDNVTDTAKIRYSDYLYYGYALNGLGRTQEAIGKFDLAKAKAKNVPGIDRDISDAYNKIGDYDDAIKYMRMYLASIKDEDYDRTTDMYNLGMMYFRKATGDKSDNLSETEKTEALQQADLAFAEVARLRPDSYIGYYWRAKANALMDPKYTRGLSKPYYTKALELLEQSDGEKSYMIECNKQISYYYYVKKVMPEAIKYARNILALDPEDSYAKQLLSIAGAK